MMNTIPIELNNYGASLVSQGKLKDAVATFKDALKSARDLLQSTLLQGEKSSKPSPNRTITRPLSPGVWLSDDKFPGRSNFLVYSQPERIDLSSQEKSLNSMSAEILFNLALTHHLEALSNPPKAAFAIVIQLYEHAYRLFTQTDDGDSFLALAVLNNLAHVHCKLQNMDDAEKICGLLWGAVLDAQNQDDSEHSLSAFEEFFTNVVHIAFKHSQQAAAA